MYCKYLLPSLWHQNFETNHSFLIKQILYITKKAGQKSKYLKNEKGF